MNLDTNSNLLLSQPCFVSLVTNLDGEIVSCLNSKNDRELSSSLKNNHISNIFPKYISDSILNATFISKEKNHSKITNLDDPEYKGFYSVETNKITYLGSILFHHNISRVKKIERNLFMQSNVFRSIFDKASVGIIQVDLNGFFMMMNTKYCNILGYSKEELLKISVRDLTHPDDIEITNTYYKNILGGKIDHYSLEKRLLGKNGSIVWVDLFVSLIRDSNCQPDYFIGIIHNITQRKKAEQILRESEKRLGLLFDQSTLGIIEWDLAGNVVEWNKKAEDIFGYKAEEVRGKHFSFFVPSNIAPEIDEVWDELKNKSGIKNSWNQNIRKEGQIIWCEWVNTSLTDDKDNLISIVSFVKDVTKKMEYERALIESESRLSAMVDHSPSGAVYVENGEISFNKAVEKIIGYSKNEIKTIDDWFMFLYKENSLEVVQMYEEDQRIGFPEPRIMYITCKNDEQKWIYFSAYKHNKGEIWLVNDVTESTESEIELIKKNKELLISKNKAEESDKLKTAFLSNVSHEIRTPMNSIIGFSEMLLDPDLTREELEEYSNIIINGGKRLLDIVEDIMDISKIESHQIEAFNEKVKVNEVINELFTTYTINEPNKYVSFDRFITLNNEDSLIYCDKSKLYKILDKLLSNAFKFTEKGYIKYGYKLEEDFLEFFVEDSGIGIESCLHKKIFESFRQANLKHTRDYEGAGLGLSIAKNYVELLGGKIWVNSEIGKGTKFFFTIPYNPVIKKIEPLENAFVDKSKRKTILVVDDEKNNNMLLIVILSKKNYNVLSAFNGLDALELCKTHPEIDLVLMDIKMDKMNGIESAKEIKKIRPNLKIFAQSAYHNDKYFNMDDDNYFDKYIMKPIKHTLLLDMIKEELMV